MLAIANRLRQTPVERFEVTEQLPMVSPQMLKLVSEIERGENRQVHRIYRLAAGANSSDPFVNCRGQSSRPFVAIIAGDRQVLAHYLDVDALHSLAQIQTVEARQNLLDPQLDFAARAFLLA